jgi:hypothetical protein
MIAAKHVILLIGVKLGSEKFFGGLQIGRRHNQFDTYQGSEKQLN